MELGDVAKHFDKTNIDVYNELISEWENDLILGQFKLADDFISIFNRPTRRRMLFLHPDAYEKISQFSLIREAKTGFLYIFGEPQYDLADSAYRVTLPLHKVVSQTTITRRATTGPSNDPGILGDTVLPASYCDIELRTLSNEGDTDQSIYEKHFIWLQKTVDLIKGDILVFLGETYKVLSVYKDTGFTGARITNEPDSRETYTYRQRSGDPTYVPLTGAYTLNYNDFQISAELEGIESESDDGNITFDVLYTVLIEYSLIGFTPAIGDAITIGGKDKVVVKVERPKHLESWKVTLR